MTPTEFIALAEKKRWHLNAILKKLPGDRTAILGFEYGKNSRKYTHKFLFSKLVFLEDLRKAPPTLEQVQKFNERIAAVRKESAPDLTDFTPGTDTSIAPARVG